MAGSTRRLQSNLSTLGALLVLPEEGDLPLVTAPVDQFS